MEAKLQDEDQPLAKFFEKYAHTFFVRHLRHVLFSMAGHVVFMLVMGYIYVWRFTYAYNSLRRPPEPRREGFAFGLFEGFNCDPDARIFFCSLCCGAVRWADTASAPKVDFVRSFFFGLLVFS